MEFSACHADSSVNTVRLDGVEKYFGAVRASRVRVCKC
jgi:hypothetical protein